MNDKHFEEECGTIEEKSSISALQYYIDHQVSEEEIKDICKNLKFENNEYTNMYNSIMSKSNWTERQRKAVILYITLNNAYLSFEIAEFFNITIDEAVKYMCLSEASAYTSDY
jgi:hypothetical protein